MNKTIIININGIVFHIEEDAYEILKNYMTDVKRHFLNSADSLEITTDIENRVAEMFSELLAAENKQVIVEQDVNTVIEQMGRVEDFDSIYDDAKSTAFGAESYNIRGRRLFRDPDDHLISGVCAGIADYFNIQPLWIRLAFALSFFFFGSGLLLYIILWIVIPQAVTRADRMAMKGQKLNLQGFKDNLEEELSAVKNNLSDLQFQARPTVYKLRDFISDLLMHIHLFFMGAGKIIIKIIGFALLLAAFIGAVVLICVLVAFLGFGAAHTSHMFPFLITENIHATDIYIAAFLTAFLPVITIIIILISALFKTKNVGITTGTTLLVIWLCALSMLIYYVAKAGNYIKDGASFTETIKLKASPDNVYYLKLNDVKYLTHDDSLRLNIKEQFNNATLTNDDDDDFYSEFHNVDLSVEKSDVSQPVLVESFSARGKDYEDALINARNTKYIFVQQDSVIRMDDVLRRTAEGWHQEELHLTLKVPLNAKVIIDQELNNHLTLNNIDVYNCKSINKKDNASSATFIMMDDGLQCKVDTVVTTKTPTQVDSIRRINNAKTIARLQAQVDSARVADSVQKSK